MAHRAGPLAVARQPSCRQLVQGHALGAAGEEPLRDARPPEHGLQRPDVEVLAGMRAAQEGDVGRREVERLDAAGFEQRHRAERLDGAPKVSRYGPGRPRTRSIRPLAVHLDDVAAMDRTRRCRSGHGARGPAWASSAGSSRRVHRRVRRTARGCGGARGAARVAVLGRESVAICTASIPPPRGVPDWRAAGLLWNGGGPARRPVDPPGRSSPTWMGPRERLSGSCCSPRARASRPWPRTQPAPARWTCSPAAGRHRERRSAAGPRAFGARAGRTS